MKSAVFFDIDGTLWDEHSFIPESTRTAIHKLREKGILTFICTGRTRGFIKDERLLSLGFDGIIAGCGTYIEYDGKELFHQTLDVERVEVALTVLRKYNMPVILEGTECLYMDMEEFADNEYGKKLQTESPECLKPIKGNEGAWLVSKFSATGEEGIYQEALKELEAEYDFLIHGPHAIEFVPKGYSKASGIRKACEMLAIKQEQTYAFGDSVNDLEMLRFVAHGIAMGNGTKEAKEAAEYVTTTLHESGIYQGLVHYGLI